ncbi:Transcriptional regulatory protein ZraR [Fundidesulfovibrio magnetotacticus]|uniref:Transcriptional regulatory protein ZraR n=1 Tax=Fundidesulfovibrio magnetotacticus TaxID=2730080 RepID=A0A6V8LVR0_9BACT|nr:sigma 54-interacting transcriptional regulator [Fundidesulfovibrio magnetotacticus]GFK93757.1 Transcriptional regulatory protein ZraR [Fundidesulfovibrio magnetotacticus]
MKQLGTPFPCTSMCSFIMDSVADGVFTVDTDWAITYFNKSAEALTGIPMARALGAKCWDVFQTKDCKDVCVLRACMTDDRKIAHRIMHILRGDGTTAAVSVSAAPLKDNKGRIIGGVETLRDLTGGFDDARHVCWGSPEDFCTKDRSLTELVRILPQVAQSEATVLLLGESGTGKELFARAIHRLSGRAKGPFVAVNCGALPENLMESELFGYKAGAFTDARRDKPGRFQLAEGGTLLLDEIGDLPLALQSKILRVLQERVYEPLGGVESVAADVRVVASTNRDLARMVDEGTFRGDLYYRLNVVQFTLPPLRERSQDVPLLVDHALRHRRRAQGKDIRGVAPEAMRLLTRYGYPGNIRELENILEYACILCPGGLIQVDHLPRNLRPAIRPVTSDGPMTMDEVRYHAAVKAVKRNLGNRNAACRELGISKDTLRKILKLNGTEEK